MVENPVFVWDIDRVTTLANIVYHGGISVPEKTQDFSNVHTVETAENISICYLTFCWCKLRQTSTNISCLNLAEKKKILDDVTPTKTCTMETPGRPATLDGKPDGWTRWQTSFCMRGLPWWRWPYSKYDISNSDHDDDDQCDWLEGRWWQMEFEAKHFREFFSNWTIFFLR